MEWKTIETAPKDGEHILVTRFPATTKSPMKIAWWGKLKSKKVWKIGNKTELRWSPTHWMPLPQPPKE